VRITLLTMAAEQGASATAPSPSADDRREEHWRRIRTRFGWAYVLALVVVVVAIGVPTDRGSLLLIILAGLGITCLGRGPRAFGRVLLDWLPFTAVLVVYDVSRGIADAVGLPLHVSDVAAADRWMFGGTVPTVWLQDHLFRPGQPQWYDAVATLVYTTHFLATPVLAAVLWLRNRAVWLAFVSRVIALALAGLITYVLFPAAPPWYAAREGVIGPVVRGSSRGWLWLHVNKAGNLLREGQVAANPVAAMPSLHTAYATIIALFVLAYVRSRLRWLIVLYPLAMGLSLVYLGEHYVVDLLAGVGYALAVHLLIGAWERRRNVQWRPPRAHTARRGQELDATRDTLSK
jgi:membrane-associated phospholipid phosphatase